MTLGVSVLMVIAAWLSVTIAYAVRYARIGAESLAFPGDPPDTLADYLCLAFAAQAAFGTADVEVRTTEARRVVTGHVLLAFAFNSVILATVVSLLLGVS
ncbi:MAG: DUF1345 domain-containing protein [Propioniciclava sp.]|uniref:DUF1345 domain-containing protein n=1 Tax=Propioniciclava sp. TaxID=2038686 RepID=UPI0039E348DA